MRLGELDIHLVRDGTFRLDGGAMFGVVPKPLWSKAKSPDERNRILMGTNCLLVRSGAEIVLVDTGIGDKLEERERAIFAVERGFERLPEAIRRAGYELEDVRHVVHTHLHFDHCGWSTRLRDGRLEPTFPRARYWLQRDEVERARHPDLRSRASYDPRSFEPLFEAGVVELFEEEAQPVSGVRAVRAPGHTEGMCIVLVQGGAAETAVHFSDLVPTVAHVPYPWIMAFDLFPMQVLESKRRWLPRAAAGGWLCVFGHDPDVPLARLEEERPGRYRAAPVAPEMVADS